MGYDKRTLSLCDNTRYAYFSKHRDFSVDKFLCDSNTRSVFFQKQEKDVMLRHHIQFPNGNDMACTPFNIHWFLYCRDLRVNAIKQG